MTMVTIQEAQSRLADLIHQLREGDEIAISEGDVVVARLVGERRPTATRPGPGLCRGMLTVVADDDEHLTCFTEYMP